MAISAAEVNKLRKATGAGMMDCKKALEEANGNFDEAITILRKKGQKVSAKRANREATEGKVVAIVNDDNKFGIAVSLNCETDFVAKNEEFQSIADSIAEIALNHKPENLEALLDLALDGRAIRDIVSDMVGKIGEKIEVGAYEKLESDAVVAYNHMGNKIGVLVGLSNGNNDAENAGRDVAMQIAAMNPVALDENSVPQKAIDQELEVAREQILAEGKPENMVDKIAQGKLNKFFKENTLVNQPFVNDNKQTVQQYLQGIDSNLKITDFKRVSVTE